MANITNDQMQVMIKIIGAVETGGQVYGQCDYSDYTPAYTNSSAENSITIGAFQEFNWYAKALLKEILDTYPDVFKKYDNAGIQSDLNKSSWDGYSPSKTSNKAKAIKSIIGSPQGIKIQNVRIERLIKGYVAFAESQGVTDVDALFMSANFIHQGGNSALTRILKKTAKPYTLNHLYTACQSDTGNQVGAYKSRQKFVYESLKKYLKISITNGGDVLSNITKEQAINAMIKVAESEIGYLEKASNSQLDSKTENAGYNNYTKYWRDIKPEFQGQPYCAGFVSWVFMKAFGIETAKKLLKHWPYVYCPTLGSLFTKYANPEVGDIVIFYRNGTFAHTGIVVKVSGDYFETIEGNTSGGSEIIPNGGGVCRKSYYNSNLPGTKFCRPDYSLVTSINNSNSSTTTTTTKNYLSYGDSGEEVKTLQKNLNKLGYKGQDGKSLDEDGGFGTNTLYAVEAFQKAHKLTVDGQAGKITLDAINNEIKALQSNTGASTSATSSTVKKLIKDGQIHLNNFVSAGLKLTGKRDAATKQAFIKSIQFALNKDYGYNFSCKGIWGPKTEAALSKITLHNGSKGYLVTALEIGLLIHNVNPNGVESPGSFGKVLETALKKYQKANGLLDDGVAGVVTFKKLIE